LLPFSYQNHNPQQIPEEMLDVVFDTFSGSSRAYIADRFKVEKQLQAWRKDDKSFDMAAFERGLAVSRATLLFTYSLLIAMQAAAWFVFFINPLTQRYLFNPHE
jgi:hypothetical protein